jgi:hypothetical protein
LRRETDCLLATSALPVDRGAGHALGEACPEEGVAGDVHGLVADLGDGARDDVVDLGWVDPGAFHYFAQAVGEQVDREHAVQRAVGLALADGGADGADDDGVAIRISRHGVLLDDSSLSTTIYT